ncbi:MAG: hypothetical protein ACTSRX_05930 [Promethearchaeota archaeon]
MTEKKVDILIIVDKNYLKIKNKNIWRKLTSVAKIQVIDNVLFDGFLFDYDEMVMFLTTFFKISIKEEDMIFLISESRLINYTKTYFKMLWSMGEKFLLKNFI